MKKFFLIITSLFIFSIAFSQTEGELNVSVTTSHAGGEYRPSHLLAIWVEDEDGYFVKSLKVYAETYIFFLNIWIASTITVDAPLNKVDAITGPTVISHKTRTCTWDGKNYLGEIVPDGIYKLRMELTDKNDTGNYSTFMFEKSENIFSSTPDDEPSFSNVNITWMPNTNSIKYANNKNKPEVYPNPNRGIIYINSEKQYFAELRNIKGQIILTEKTSYINITGHPDGVYFLKLSSENETYHYKLFKNSM